MKCSPVAVLRIHLHCDIITPTSCMSGTAPSSNYHHVQHRNVTLVGGRVIAGRCDTVPMTQPPSHRYATDEPPLSTKPLSLTCSSTNHTSLTHDKEWRRHLHHTRSCRTVPSPRCAVIQSPLPSRLRIHNSSASHRPSARRRSTPASARALLHSTSLWGIPYVEGDGRPLEVLHGLGLFNCLANSHAAA